MEPETEQEVRMYLADESKLYQDWYKAITQQEDDSLTVPCGPFPSPESLKKKFDDWVTDNKSFLKEKICKGWKYFKTIDDKQRLIAAVMTDVIALTPVVHPKFTVVTIALLVINGYLDKLCSDCAKQ